jgi:hypothetical protein
MGGCSSESIKVNRLTHAQSAFHLLELNLDGRGTLDKTELRFGKRVAAFAACHVSNMPGD